MVIAQMVPSPDEPTLLAELHRNSLSASLQLSRQSRARKARAYGCPDPGQFPPHWNNPGSQTSSRLALPIDLGSQGNL